jgi:hypothetical protein
MDTNTLTPDVPCEVMPRHDATSEQLQQLGQALADWSEAEFRAGGLLRFIDNIVLAELLGGDDPSEFLFAVLYDDDDNDCLTITRRAPAHADPAEAARRLIVSCLFAGTAYDRRRVIERLRQAVPAGLVQDVVIAGRSWNLPD